MNEESQVRGCYNITFYLHTNQPGNSVCVGKDTHLEYESKRKD